MVVWIQSRTRAPDAAVVTDDYPCFIIPEQTAALAKKTETRVVAVFDVEGVLRQLGVRLVPSPYAETEVDALGGTRHTSGVRYSHDDPTATVIVVSEDGPVSVLRAGEVLRLGPPPAP